MKSAPASPMKKAPQEEEHILKKRAAAKKSSKGSKSGKNSNCQCGIRKPSFGIVNGMRTTAGEFPWQVALHRQNGAHMCGAVIISDEWVLTAAHCPVSEGMKVIAGVSNLRRSQNKQEKTVTRVIPHPSYYSGPNDIQVLQVDSKFEFNDYVTPICLPFDLEDQTFADVRAEYSGWGRFLRRSSISSPILYKLHPTVLSNSECQSRGEHPEVIESQICAEGDNVSGVCHGDSGGPLVYEVNPNQFTVIGLVSYGPSECYKVDVYTRVSSFLDWIVDNTGVSDFCRAF